jgi:tetratricopeptide (TPR) repeat protein
MAARVFPGTFRGRQGKWADWDSAAQAALAAATRAGDQTGLGWTRLNLAVLHSALEAYSEACVQYRHALRHVQQADDLVGQSIAHEGVSAASVNTTWFVLRPHKRRNEVPSPSPEQRQRASEDLAHAEQALTIHRRLGRRDHEAHTLGQIACHHAILGDFELALNTSQQALDLAREIGRRDEAVEWDVLNFVHRLRGDYRTAIYCGQQPSARCPSTTP